jgi:hypothetical protein
VDPDVGVWRRRGRYTCEPMGRWMNPVREEGGGKMYKSLSEE